MSAEDLQRVEGVAQQAREAHRDCDNVPIMVTRLLVELADENVRLVKRLDDLELRTDEARNMARDGFGCHSPTSGGVGAVTTLTSGPSPLAEPLASRAVVSRFALYRKENP